MKVYIVVGEPYHELSDVGDVFCTLELAMASHPGTWERAGFYVTNREGAVAQLYEREYDYAHVIYEREVKGV